MGYFSVVSVCNGKIKKRKKLFWHWIEHVLVDHVAAGIVQPCTLLFLLDHSKEREFHVHAGDMTEHLFEFNLLCVHEECVGDFCRAEFFALATVHTGVRDMGKPDEVEHEIGRKFAGFDICRILGCAILTITDGTGFNARVALDAP